jgi:hypothetical protein
MAYDRIHFSSYDVNDSINGLRNLLNDKFNKILKDFKFAWVPLNRISILLHGNALEHQLYRCIQIDKKTIMLHDKTYVKFIQLYVDVMFFKYDNVDKMHNDIFVPLVQDDERIMFKLITEHIRSIQSLNSCQLLFNDYIGRAENHLLNMSF